MFGALKAIPLKLSIIILLLVSLLVWALFPDESQDTQISEAPSSQLIADASASNTSDSVQKTPNNVLIVEGSKAGSDTILGGTVIPARDVTLTAQLSGQVKFLAGREGDRFTQNTLLVGINADQLQARRQAAIAQLQNAQSEINNAQVQYQRELISPQSLSLSRSGGMGMPLLFDQMFTRPMASFMPGGFGGNIAADRSADLYTVSTQLTQAQGRYMQIKSKIDEIDAQIADSRVNTPFPGIILERMIEVGDSIQEGEPLLRYANLSRLQVEAQVPASIVSRLANNMIISIRLGDAEYESNARVEQIFPSANAQRRTVTVKLDLPNNSRAIPGMYAELLLPADQKNQALVPVVPVSAVIRKGSLPTIHVLDENDQVQLRMIRLGEQIPGDKVTVISGLRIGERILSRP